MIKRRFVSNTHFNNAIIILLLIDLHRECVVIVCDCVQDCQCFVCRRMSLSSFSP